ncbi:MAG TPA: hypothetical protein VGB83_12315 [Actinomycetota bacterium]
MKRLSKALIAITALSVLGGLIPAHAGTETTGTHPYVASEYVAAAPAGCGSASPTVPDYGAGCFDAAVFNFSKPKVNVSVADTTANNPLVHVVFHNAAGDRLGAVDFCGSKTGIAVMEGATRMWVYVSAAVFALLEDQCDTPATTGTITVNFHN